MKKLFLAAFVMSSFPSLKAQSWTWADAWNCNADTWTLAVDNLGYIYATSLYNGCPGNTFEKYSPAGNPMWGFTEPYDINAMRTDKSEHVITVGQMWGGFTFGSLTAPNTGNPGICIMKLDSAGNPLWGNYGYCTSATNLRANATSVATDKFSNVYVTGTYLDSVKFGNTWLTSGINTTTDAFLVKYNAAGVLRWATTPLLLGSNRFCYSTAVASDSIGNTYVTGVYGDSIKFGSFSLGGRSWLYNNLPNFDGNSFFVKYDSTGNVVWAKTTESIMPGGSWGTAGISDATDSKGNIYFGGYVRDSVTIDNDTFPGINCSSFIMKCNSAGTIDWYKVIKGYQQNGIFSIATDLNDNIILEGSYLPNSTYYNTLDNDTLPNAGSGIDPWGYIIKLDSMGNYQCQTVAININDGPKQGAADETTIAIDPWGNVVISGDVDDTTAFGTISFNYSNNTEFPFLAKWQPCGVNSTEGINNSFSKENHLIFYPNPSNGKFTIQVPDVNSNYSVAIYNAFGKIISDLRVNSNKVEFDLSDKPKGIYFVNVICNGKNYTGKIILE